MRYSLKDLMELIVAEGGEAAHLHEEEAPVLEVKWALHRIEGPPVAIGETEELFQEIAPPDDLSELRTNGLSSVNYMLREPFVFQVMAFREDGRTRLEIRRL